MKSTPAAAPASLDSARLGRFGPVLLVILAGLAAAAPLWFGPGIINTRAGGDSPFLLIRTFELAANLRAGVLPARWMPDAALGLGFPFFKFYAALPYYLAACMSLLGVELTTAIKLTQTVGMVAAGVSMLVWARTLLPAPGAALAGAAYTFAPFHLVNVYVRGDSLSEFYAFVWYPLILWAVGRLIERATRGRLATLALLLAALVLTHNVSALIFAPFIGLWALAGLARPSVDRRAAMAGLGIAAILALWLSAGLWLPALGEAGSVQLGDQTTGYFNYANHFRGLDLVQASTVVDYHPEGAKFALGLLQAALAVLGGIVWLIRAAPRGRAWAGLALGSLVVSGVMITPLSAPVWAALKPLQLAQFPWRFLSVASLFAALCVGGLLTAAPGWLGRAGCVATSVVLGIAAMAALPAERLNVQGGDVTPASIQFYEWHTGNLGTTIRAEYLPASALPWPRVGFGVLGEAPKALAVSGGPVSSTLAGALPAQQIWRVDAGQAGLVALPLIYTPAWTAIDENGGAVALRANPGSGWAQAAIPAGTHTLILRYTGTPLERAGDWAGLIGLLACLALVAGRRDQRARLWAGRGRLMDLSAGLGVLVALGWALSPKPEPAPMRIVDARDRLFPHRGPAVLRDPAGQPHQLTAASVTPERVRPGEAFTLTLHWSDIEAAPAGITVTQDAPNATAYADAAHVFRFVHQPEALPAGGGPLRTIAQALPGPMLLTLSLGGADDAPVMLLGPTVTEPGAQNLKPALHQFNNGIRLQDIDVFQATGTEVCIRPAWALSAPGPAWSDADALQMSLRLRGADGQPLIKAWADGQPQAGLAPTWAWPRDVLIQDAYCGAELSRPPAPDEPVTLEIVWYRRATFEQVDSVTLRGRYTLSPDQVVRGFAP